jgi:hypothetical protein
MQSVEAGDLFETHTSPSLCRCLIPMLLYTCGVGNIYSIPASLTSSMSNRHGVISHPNTSLYFLFY